MLIINSIMYLPNIIMWCCLPVKVYVFIFLYFCHTKSLTIKLNCAVYQRLIKFENAVTTLLSYRHCLLSNVRPKLWTASPYSGNLSIKKLIFSFSSLFSRVNHVRCNLKSFEKGPRWPTRFVCIYKQMDHKYTKSI
jgi:hypothetical protein